MNFDDVAIVTGIENDYRIHFWDTAKTQGVRRMRNVDLREN